MLKPELIVDKEQLSLVVKVGDVKLALPPRLSRLVQLYHEEKPGLQKVHGGDLIEDFAPNHCTSNQDSNSREEIMTTPQRGRGKRRRDYRSLVNSHKGPRKLPQLPSDPALSIFNNLHSLGVLEAELDVKKMELLVKKKRQEIAEEIRRLSPEQRSDLISESPFLRSKVQEAIYARNSTSSTSPLSSQGKCLRYDNGEADIASLQSVLTPSSCPPSPSSCPSSSPPTSPSSGGLSYESPARTTPISPLPQHLVTDDDLASLYSSYTDLRTFNTATSSPILQEITYDNSEVTYDNSEVTYDNSEVTYERNSITSESTLSYHGDQILDSRTTEDLTNITQPAISYEVLTSSENTLKISEYSESLTETSTQSVNTESLTHQSICNGNIDHCVSDPALVTPHKKAAKRTEVCTPLHPSVSEPSLSNNNQELSESYDSVRSMPPVSRSVSDEVSEILSRNKLQNEGSPLKKSQSEKSISEKLEEIQAKLSPRSSYLTQAKNYHSYTLSYGSDNEVLLGDVRKHRLKTSFSEDDLDYMRESVGMSVTKQNLLNSLISPPDAWSDMELYKSHDAELYKSHDEELYKSHDIEFYEGHDMDFYKNFDFEEETEEEEEVIDENRKEEEEEEMIEQVLDGLTDSVLEHLLSLHASNVYNALPPYSAVDPEMSPLPMVVPDEEEEIVRVCEGAVEYFITCLQCGNVIVLRDAPLPDISSSLTPEESSSISSFHLLVITQSYELFTEAINQFNLVSCNDLPPPWIREQCKGPRPSWLLPLSSSPALSSLKALISGQVVSILCTPLPPSIDQLLFKEELQVDIEWRDYHKDEVALKFRLADMLLASLIDNTVATLANID